LILYILILLKLANSAGDWLLSLSFPTPQGLTRGPVFEHRGFAVEFPAPRLPALLTVKRSLTSQPQRGF
jgi:hypothetical protein